LVMAVAVTTTSVTMVVHVVGNTNIVTIQMGNGKKTLTCRAKAEVQQSLVTKHYCKQRTSDTAIDPNRMVS
jgi:hypothetical protein